jgi:hypothetical protein
MIAVSDEMSLLSKIRGACRSNNPVSISIIVVGALMPNDGDTIDALKLIFTAIGYSSSETAES